MEASLPHSAEPSILSENINTDVDVHRITAMFRRRLKLFVAVGALVFAAGALITFQQVPRYTATARVLIDQRKQQIVAPEQTVVSGLPDESSAVDTEVEVLRSRSIAERVAAQSALFTDPRWNGSDTKPGLLHRIRNFFAPADKKAVDPQIQKQEVIDALLDGLDVQRANDTFMIDVAYTSEDPAERVAFACEHLLRGVHAYEGSVRAAISHTITAPGTRLFSSSLRFLKQGEQT